MVTEEDNPLQPGMLTGAPTLPVHFALPDASTPASPHLRLGLLPPRREKRNMYRERYGPASAGFLDARLSFTGSPIPEHSHPNTGSGGSATAGSLQKVRRLTKQDDVVSASGQHLYQRRRHYLSSIDTSTSDLSDNDDDRISPTDILSFPPPTPVKHRPPPPTPVAQRRHEKLVQRRTPHPGSILRRHAAQPEEHTASSSSNKSRFYDDFDIIQELGKGSFGNVYQVLSRLDGVSGECCRIAVLVLDSLKLTLVGSFLCEQCMYAIKAAQRPAKGAADRDRMLKEVSEIRSTTRLEHSCWVPCFTYYVHCFCDRSMHWPRFRIKRTRQPFILFVIIRHGWRRIGSLFKPNFVKEISSRKWNRID